MKQLILRNLKLRKHSLIFYLILILMSPIHHFFSDQSTIGGSMFYSLLSLLILFITFFDCGNAFRLQFKLGGSKAFAFNHSLPFSAKEQLNAHYLTTLIMSLAGFIVIIIYFDVPIGGEIDSVTLSSPFSFIAVNLIGHAIAFPKYSEVRRDFIPYWGFIIMMNLVLPFIAGIGLLLMIVGIKYLNGTSGNPSDYLINSCLTICTVAFTLISIVVFVLTYLKQLKIIKSSEQH